MLAGLLDGISTVCSEEEESAVTSPAQNLHDQTLFTPSLAELLHDFTSICSEEEPATIVPEVRRHYKSRRLPRLTVDECTHDILSLQCNCEKNCFDLIKQLDKASQTMASARIALEEAGHRRSSKLLFDMLLAMRFRIGTTDKFVFQYNIQGCRVCDVSWFLYHGLNKGDDRVKRVMRRLRCGDMRWIPDRKRKVGRSDERGLMATVWLKQYLEDYAEQMPDQCIYRFVH